MNANVALYMLEVQLNQITNTFHVRRSVLAVFRWPK